MHSTVNGYCPTSLRNMFQRNEHRELNQDLRNANQFTIPYPRIELFKISRLFRLSTEWNALTTLNVRNESKSTPISNHP